MPSYFDRNQGFLRSASWHKLEHAILTDSPRTWEEARQSARLTWDVIEEPVFTRRWVRDEDNDEVPVYTEESDWKALRRNDTKATLAIQPASYAVISNSAFGQTIERVLAQDIDGEPLQFEALFTLQGGKLVVALIRFENVAAYPWDPNGTTYRFVAFISRHDGNGGLRGMPTNIRVECWNTLQAAEMSDGRYSGFTIRHTSNWEERVKLVREGFITARAKGDEWDEFLHQLSDWDAGARQRETFLKRFLPISDADTVLKVRNTEVARSDIRRILESATCTGISGSGYGLLMAATEWTDHVRRARSVDSSISRQLVTPSSHKTSAVRILKGLARV